MPTSAQTNKALFLAQHPPRRFWPDQNLGYYISPSHKAAAPARKSA